LDFQQVFRRDPVAQYPDRELSSSASGRGDTRLTRASPVWCALRAGAAASRSSPASCLRS